VSGRCWDATGRDQALCRLNALVSFKGGKAFTREEAGGESISEKTRGKVDASNFSTGG